MLKFVRKINLTFKHELADGLKLKIESPFLTVTKCTVCSQNLHCKFPWHTFQWKAEWVFCNFFFQREKKKNEMSSFRLFPVDAPCCDMSCKTASVMLKEEHKRDTLTWRITTQLNSRNT